MNTIEQMIHDLCPDGVKRVRLGECCIFQRGSTITAKDAIAGDIPVIAGGQKPAYYHNVSNRSGESITIAGSGAYAGYVAYWDTPIYVSDAFTIEFKQGLGLPKYLYYFLKNIQEKIHNTKKGSGVPHVHPSSIDTIEIPLPPLSIQAEIVKILDRFAVLSAELEAELEARRKQYEYYRTRLLSFDSDSRSDTVQWRALGEVCMQKSTITWKTSCETYQYIDLSSVDRNNKCITITSTIDKESAPSRAQQIIHKDDILFGTTRPLLKRYCLVPERYNMQICSTGFCVLRPNIDIVMPQWIYYMISTDKFYSYIESVQSGASYPCVSDILVKAFLIPIPPLAEQERIVNILDKFDQLVNGVKDSIPELIDKVQKQYEHYRNKLLTFPEA